MRAWLMLLAFPGAVWGAAPQAAFQWESSTAPIQLGEKTVLRGSARLASATVLELDLAGSATDTFLIQSHQVLLPENPADSSLRTFAIEILPLTVGKLPVHLSWTVLQGAQGAATIKSPPVIVEISEPSLSEDGTPRDIKEPLKARAALWPWLLALAAAAALYYLYRRFSRRIKPQALPAEQAPADGRSPHERASDELDELESSPLWTENRHKEFYAALTDILRRYFDGRFGIPAFYLTTTELARQLRQAEIDRKIIFGVREIFDRADLVKFAKISPEKDIGPLDIASSRTLIAETAPADLKATVTP